MFLGVISTELWPVLLHRGIYWTLRGHQRVRDADSLRAWHLEQHDGAGGVHERQCGVLRGHQRVDGPDALCPGHLEQHDRPELMHPGVPGTLRGYEWVHV